VHLIDPPGQVNSASLRPSAVARRRRRSCGSSSERRIGLALSPQYFQSSWLVPSLLPISQRALVLPDRLREIHLPPAAVTAILPEPVDEGPAKVARDSQGEFYQAGIFSVC
jgi:hypothetical protein